MIKINAADLVALKQEAAAEILYASIYSSYNLDGLMAYAKEIEGNKLSILEQNKLMKEKVDLNLMPGHGLSEIRELGSDFVVAAKWVQKNQDSLCPNNGKGMTVERKGMLFEKGLCVDNATQLEKSLAFIEAALKGTFDVPMGGDAAAPVIKHVNIFAFLDQPPKNMGMLFPVYLY